MQILIIALTITASHAACLLPFATPPSKAQVVGGGVARAGQDTGATDSAGGAMAVRGSLQPFQLSESLLRRRFDVGIGYGAMFPGDVSSSTIHGPYVDLTVYPYIDNYAANSPARLAVTLAPELAYARREDRDIKGRGVSLTVAYEKATFTSGGFGSNGGDSAVGGAGIGEASFGVALTASARELEGARMYSLMAGITLRIPASIGFLFVVPH